MHHSTQSGYGSVLGGLQAVEPGRQAEARPRRHNAEPEEVKAEGRRPEAAGQQGEQGCGADGQGSQQLGTIQVESALTPTPSISRPAAMTHSWVLAPAGQRCKPLCHPCSNS